MKTLTIKLSSPLQSYGNEATFNHRTTWDYPSKSAIIGMLAAAMGYRRDDPRITELNDLKFAVRVDQPGQTMTEFQTIQWDPKKSSKITYRGHIQDAVFMVAIGSEDDQFINILKSALLHPKFQLFLGRRANPPAGPLQLHLIDDQNPVQVLTNLDWQASAWLQKKTKQETVSVDVIADASLLPETKMRPELVKDRVVSFDPRHRQMRFRPVLHKRVQLNNDQYTKQMPNTDHNIMNSL